MPFGNLFIERPS